MLKVKTSSRFKKDYKKVKSQVVNLTRFEEAVRLLSSGTPLPEDYKDHSLKGNWKGHRECHLGFDWLLIYKIKDDTLMLARIGSHNELFGK